MNWSPWLYDSPIQREERVRSRAGVGGVGTPPRQRWHQINRHTQSHSYFIVEVWAGLNHYVSLSRTKRKPGRALDALQHGDGLDCCPCGWHWSSSGEPVMASQGLCESPSLAWWKLGHERICSSFWALRRRSRKKPRAVQPPACTQLPSPWTSLLSCRNTQLLASSEKPRKK